MTTRRKKPEPKPTGPTPEVLAIEGDWEDAVGHALKRGKPPADPPKQKPKKKRKR